MEYIKSCSSEKFFIYPPSSPKIFPYTINKSIEPIHRIFISSSNFKHPHLGMNIKVKSVSGETLKREKKLRMNKD